ncbi:transcriptional regulator, MarR family [Aliiroseovarius crassostreae]|uniref:MarR family winged helix-turn-helix transcriptional regulator n=1 Tax=Aliiroseovarius crassostreae TaxID=154981 RepID=UPI0008F0DF26|nr:MarR family winged helix-turn-helix transcriptional regulator [Aliiroseovarius crassostreae]SFU95676.1 transcriptional regulator, MarR family [Aliiroseovarius crassostreae]
MKSASGEDLYAGVRLVRPLLRRITARVERDLQGTDISVGQRAILEALHETKRATAPMLTEWLDMKRQFVARELKVLLKSGMVEKSANPDHARSPFYVLTHESADLIGAVREREKQAFEAFADQFTVGEVASFRKIMEALYGAMLVDEHRVNHHKTGSGH